jgi:DeoR family fructose operon transcriptional repressor
MDIEKFPKLTKKDRLQKIIELAKSNNYLQVAELAEVFKVSTMTLRRDLEELEQTEKIQRVHGGARIKEDLKEEAPYIFRTREYSEEKSWIGKKAASLIENGDLIALDVGSTLLEVAKNINSHRKIAVLTHWIPIIQYLISKPGIKTIILGGILRNSELSIVGNLTCDVLRNFHPSKVFLGVSGICAEKGIITDFNMEEVDIKKELIRQGSEVIVVADHSKINKIAPVTVCKTSDIHKLVTDQAITEEELKKLRQTGMEVLVAGPET